MTVICLSWSVICSGFTVLSHCWSYELVAASAVALVLMVLVLVGLGGKCGKVVTRPARFGKVEADIYNDIATTK